MRLDATGVFSPTWLGLDLVRVSGFRSFAAAELCLSDVNVLIGPNGAGKSNFLAFLKMVAAIFSGGHALERYVAQAGRASAVLHRGPKATQRIEAQLRLSAGSVSLDYEFILAHAEGDSFYFDLERCRGTMLDNDLRWFDGGVSHISPKISRIVSEYSGNFGARLNFLLATLDIYHFQDTSRDALIKQSAPETDSQRLRGDGANLAPVLLRLQRSHPAYYQRILATLRQVAPFFGDFVLEPEGGRVLLRWQEAGSEVVFGPHQLSDGTIRAMALLTLLLQPPELMPGLLIIDEPELGLHPVAIRIIAGLVRAAAVQRQCIVATQSPQFLDEFDASEVVVADRDETGSHLRRLSPEALAQWLHGYSLSDLWSINFLGGRPGSVARP